MPVRTKDKKNTDLFFWKGYHGTKNQAERDQYRRKYPSDSENEKYRPDEACTYGPTERCVYDTGNVGEN